MQSPTASRLEGGNIRLWLLILQSTTGFPTSNCPRDQQQTRQLVEFQRELTVSADPPLVQAAFRAGLGAQWTFLSDEQRVVIKQLNILDETEGEYAYRSQPYTFVLCPDLRIHAIYNGWYFVGRPTTEELRRATYERLCKAAPTVAHPFVHNRVGYSPSRLRPACCLPAPCSCWSVWANLEYLAVVNGFRL